MSATINRHPDIVIVGSGLAGLVCALSLAPRPVTIITKTSKLAGGSSWCAQGGIAAAIGPDDSPILHAADTVAAGAGLSDPLSVQQLTEESAQGVQWLLEQGVRFDQTASGSLSLSKEAAHHAARVVHAGGDATGKVVMQRIVEQIVATPSIRVFTNTFVDDLITEDNHIRGLVAFKTEIGWHQHRASHVILATGGIGTLWLHTTNPAESTGDGLAMAARAGAEMADLEFVQFHPTALAEHLDNGDTNLPLLTEALRGAGATLIDNSGVRFMLDEHEQAELAPRDIVARAIHRRMADGHRVYLDLRPILAAGNSSSFPHALDVAKQYGFDPALEALPVTPAAHYHMGGVATDYNGRTSVAGLWACGEVAATGVHGANRLASNSLLEALTYARRVASRVSADIEVAKRLPVSTPITRLERETQASESTKLDSISQTVSTVMSQRVGILRSGPDLDLALATLNDLQREFDSMPSRVGSVRLRGEIRNRLLVAQLVTLAALRREESRGAHYRDDFPIPQEHWQRHQVMTINSINALEF